MNTKLPCILAVALAAAGCKPQASGDQASLKTLDNFTRDDGTSVKTYFCGIAMNEGIFQHLSASDRHIADSRIIVPGNDKALKYAVAGALAAVPKAMQQVFFAAQGKIRVVQDAKKECSKVALTDAEKKFASENARDNGGAYSFDGCWQVNDGKVDVILSTDLTVIHHGLLRLFTYVYTQVFSRGVDGVPELATGVARFKKQRYQLGVALLQDLYAVSREKGQIYAAYSTADREAYENAVFSETIDSGYCSASSRAVFERQFPKAFAAFSKGPDSLLKDFGDPLY